MKNGSLSIFFYAGDFAEALRRHREGEQQAYATHNEVAELISDLAEIGTELTLYSYVTPEAKVERPMPGVRIVSLGAKDYAQNALLCSAVAADASDALIPHFPSRPMLRAARKTGKRLFPILASSFYRRTLRSRFEAWRLAALLNDDAFDLVSNHCRPATEHLAALGVRRGKLVPWDVPHKYDPGMTTPKTLRQTDSHQLLYVGAITAAKGVSELLHAVALVDNVRCALVGNGNMAEMTALAHKLGIENRVAFLGHVGNNDVFDLMRDADAIVVPSRAEFQEGLPLVMFEAVASHTPIICSDHPIFAAFMRDRQNACIFRSGNARDLARAIMDMFDDPARYAALSRAAEDSWRELGGTADWRTMVKTWFLEGPDARWIRDHALSSQSRDGEPV